MIEQSLQDHLQRKNPRSYYAGSFFLRYLRHDNPVRYASYADEPFMVATPATALQMLAYWTDQYTNYA
ncbi:hypothetical protein [Chitinophaga rhizophila]|uniref:Uncharacterized protein n=1 Tax=Chitinophaga rhizophila TaxID=2866212 RepID=A0ABS7G5I1_9BACT|nr:hypothetical protein [Chitinophaga rhizophila]MBW8682878.1 hypothetical protein [Chitinophaga rhizophila]